MTLTQIIHQIGDRVRLFCRVIGLTGGTFAVDSVVITDGGNSYVSAPAVLISGGGGSGATATAQISGGRVVGITMTANGTGYTSVPTVSFSGGSGSGAVAVAVILGEKLDAIPTAALSLAYPLMGQIMIGNEASQYRLRAGTDANDSPFIIRPVDYNAGTNARVWELVTLVAKKTNRPDKALAYAGTVNIDMDGPQLRDLTLAGNVIFTTSNRGNGKAVVVRITGDGSARVPTFPAWIFANAAAPTSIPASSTALLELRSFGPLDTDIVATYVSSAGGGGTQQVFIGRDPAAPDDPTKPALSYPSGGGTLTQWDVGTAAWV